MFCALASVSLTPTHATSGSVYATEGMHRASKADFCPAATSAATLPSCEALCASIGAPITSPIAKISGTLVRICLSGDDAARTDRDAGGSHIGRVAVGAAPHRYQYPV